MDKLHKTIFINASRQRVWDAMLADATYREWTAGFAAGSYYRGDWSEGSKIVFVAPNPDGTESGMVARIAVNRPHEFISIEHRGIVQNGVEDTESPEARKWAPAFENYTFIEKDGGTELVIEMDVDEEGKENFERMWSDALASLKEVAER